MATVETTYPHIEKIAGAPARLKRVPRTRVALLVMDYLAYGYSADEMVRQYPYLNIAEVHNAMGYYYDHQDEIDSEIHQEMVALEQWNSTHIPAPVVLRLKGLREELIAKASNSDEWDNRLEKIPL